MIYILICITCTTSILIIFRLLARFGADTNHTILVSYAFAAMFGIVLLPVAQYEWLSIWIIPAALEGVAFYAVFHLMARSTTLSGIAFTSVASKMSVIIPVTIGLVFLDETRNAYVFLGVLLGLTSVVLSVGQSPVSTNWGWPLLVFLGSGAIDASFKLLQVSGLTEQQFPGFITTVFIFALLTGLLHSSIRRSSNIQIPSILAGAALGLANLGTVYFIMRALAIPSLDSTVVYSLNSFGIVLTSTLVALLMFREPIYMKGYVGILLAVLSISFLYIAKL